MAERYSCAEASLACSEPRYGTASRIRRWILLEQPGPWGRDAVLGSRLPVEVGAALRVHAENVGARLLLIRRHGRYEPVGRTCLVAVTTPHRQRIERLLVGDPAELLDIDWSPLRELEAIGGEEIDEPVYLVCTNGAHDACCAQRGRPLALALSAALGDQVWESSHFGGDRFAGNLVCLPHGLYYGHVEPADGPRLANLYAKGELDLDHFRGRSSYPFPVQAAEYFARRRTGLVGVDDLRVEAVDRGEHVRVRFRLPDGNDLWVSVQETPAEAGQKLTCTATRAVHPPRYREVA